MRWFVHQPCVMDDFYRDYGSSAGYLPAGKVIVSETDAQNVLAQMNTLFGLDTQLTFELMVLHSNERLLYFYESASNCIYLLDLFTMKIVAHRKQNPFNTTHWLFYMEKKDRLAVVYESIGYADDDIEKRYPMSCWGLMFYTGDMSSLCLPLEQPRILYCLSILHQFCMIEELDILVVMYIQTSDSMETYGVTAYDISGLGMEPSSKNEDDDSITFVEHQSICKLEKHGVLRPEIMVITYLRYDHQNRCLIYGVSGDMRIVQMSNGAYDRNSSTWICAPSLSLTDHQFSDREINLLHVSSDTGVIAMADFVSGGPRFLRCYRPPDTFSQLYAEQSGESMYVMCGGDAQSLTQYSVDELFRVWTPHNHRWLIRERRRAIETLFMLYRFVPEAMPLPLELVFIVFQYMT